MYSENHPKSPSPPHFEQQVQVAGVPVLPTNQNYPAQNNMQPQAAGWSSGLFDCSDDVRSSCITFWCPCITFGQIAEILDEGSTSCGVSGALYALIRWFTGCAGIYSFYYRDKMRNRYMLEETPCADFCVHFWCDTCALCQEYRELKSRGFDMSLGVGWQGNMDRQLNRGAAPTDPVVQDGMTR